MSAQDAIPAFGGRLKTDAYYEQVDAMIRTLRPASTLRTIAECLNNAGLSTPRNYAWDRGKVATYLRSMKA
jgi:hypothetical protein